jgi:hypothetical protein
MKRWSDRLERVQGMGAGPTYGWLGGNHPILETCTQHNCALYWICASR